MGGANQCILETTALSSPVRATHNRSAVASERYSFNVKKKGHVWGWDVSRICLVGGFPVFPTKVSISVKCTWGVLETGGFVPN